MTISFVTAVKSADSDKQSIKALIQELRERLSSADLSRAEPGDLADLAGLIIRMLAAASNRNRNPNIKTQVGAAMKRLADSLHTNLDDTDPGDCKRLAATLAAIEFTAATDEALARNRRAREAEMKAEHARELEIQEKIRAGEAPDA